MNDSTDTRFIRKTYQGRELIFSQANAKYAYTILKFFFDNFADLARIPEVYSLEGDSVYLEYLPKLPAAKLLNAQTVNAARGFFERCYQFTELVDPLRSIQQSVYYSTPMKHWVEAKKPLALGLKGDLWQNLCLIDNTIVLADIDSAAIEPLGFSELVMHAEIHAELGGKNLINKVCGINPRPICYSYLSVEQAETLIDIALTFVASRMAHLSSFVIRWKIGLARNALTKSLNHPQSLDIVE